MISKGEGKTFRSSSVLEISNSVGPLNEIGSVTPRYDLVLLLINPLFSIVTMISSLSVNSSSFFFY